MRLRVRSRSSRAAFDGLEVAFHFAVCDAGLIEDAAHRSESFLEIETLGAKLSVQDCLTESARARTIDEEAQDVRADADFPHLPQNRHSANFDFAAAMIEHPAASDRHAVENRKCVKRALVVGVHFDFFGHLLLFDKDAAANRVRSLHIIRLFDRDHFDARAFIHEPVTSARWMQRQILFEVNAWL
jgi:hypothetical protein